MKIVLDPTAANDALVPRRQEASDAHRARWERTRRDLQLLAAGAATVWLVAWLVGGRGGSQVARDVTLLLNLLWGLTLLAQRTSEP